MGGGEIAVLPGSERTADITAQEAGGCRTLHRTDPDSLEQRERAEVIDLLKALTGDLGQKLSRARHQLALREIY